MVEKAGRKRTAFQTNGKPHVDKVLYCAAKKIKWKINQLIFG